MTQGPEAPVLSEIETLRIEHALAQLEAAQLRVQILTTQANAQLAAVRRDGYVLRRRDTGQWVYEVAGEG